jgi:ABC-2 type transport system ATP-binding protein
VRTPRPDELRAALERSGLSVTVARDGVLTVATRDPAQVGDLAFAAGVPLHELTPAATSLEEAFLAMTADPPAELTP